MQSQLKETDYFSSNIQFFINHAIIMQGYISRKPGFISIIWESV